MNSLIRRLLKAAGNVKQKSNKKAYRKRKKKTVVPQILHEPQRLGVGTTVARVTRVIQVIANSSTEYALMSNAFQSYEFSRQAEDYNFFRVKCINVIQHPVNVVDVDGQVWMQMDWLNDENELSTLNTCDNAKMLSYNLNKPLVYTFLPPNARLRYGDNQNELSYTDLPINYTEWLPAKHMIANPAPGWLRFMNVGNKYVTVTVDVVMEFKGSKPYDSNLLKKENDRTKSYIHVQPLQKVEAKVEEEMEEIEDEEKIEEKKIDEKKKKMRK